mgnify:FL=1
MIKKISENEIEQTYELLLNYDKNIMKYYDLKNYINSDIYNVYAYEINNKIVGIIIYTILCEEAEILLIFVDENYRNKGIATLLINSIEEKNVKNILLEVSTKNDSALALYNKLNFKLINIRKNYYKDSDAYVLRKEYL